MTGKDKQRKSEAALLWAQTQAFSLDKRVWGIHEVLTLPMASVKMTSYESKRQLIRLGQLKSQEFFKKLVNKYGY